MRISPWKALARLVLPLVLMASLAAVGCGKAKCTVSGKVLFKNAPLKGGTVTFVNDDGNTQVSPIAEDGSYTIRNIHPGAVQIAVETASMKPPEGRNAKKYTYQAPKPPEGQEDNSGYKPKDITEHARRYVPIPTKYDQPENSGLTFTVQRGEQSYDIVVPDEK
ncbi:MAG TPA: carboxypeptidase-like regulatory domain-containing protein [Gemmataceae bacterium]|nr:carboxypeptidase-like regulatory domain-containing protein [Gemmataceae bacterium]